MNRKRFPLGTFFLLLITGFLWSFAWPPGNGSAAPDEASKYGFENELLDEDARELRSSTLPEQKIDRVPSQGLLYEPPQTLAPQSWHQLRIYEI